MHNTKKVLYNRHDERIVEYLKRPEDGPNLLFFSGGSAVHNLCQSLMNYTHNSVHLLSPFDSGGSTAEIRKVLKMPAVGDVRARIMSLSDPKTIDYPYVLRLFNHRFSSSDFEGSPRQYIYDVVNNRNALINGITSPLKSVIRENLECFLEHTDSSFNFEHASIGNLVLAGGYLLNNRQLEPVIFELSKLMSVRGKVRLTLNQNYHLAASLENGRQILGQHLLTGKEHPAIESPIKTLCLSEKISSFQSVTSGITDINRKMIENADLLCFPPGSFYSSIIANLLPQGITKAISKNPNPKVYIPNLGRDPESHGLTTSQNIQQLLKFLDQNNDLEGSNGTESPNKLTHILLDQHEEYYNGTIQTEEWREKGIEIIRSDLTSARFMPYYDPHKLVQALLSLK